jgi:hypothetical protein
MPDPRDLCRERFVKNELAARTYNDRRVGFELRQGADDDETVPFVCECGDSACTAALELSPEEFFAAHDAPNRFTVRPGHVDGDVEWIVEKDDRYWVVEKKPSAMTA